MMDAGHIIFLVLSSSLVFFAAGAIVIKIIIELRNDVHRREEGNATV